LGVKSTPSSVTHLSRQLLYYNKHFKYYLNKNDQCLKFLLQLINIRASNLWQSNDIYQAWTFNAENAFVNNFKIADYFFEVRVTIVCKPA